MGRPSKGERLAVTLRLPADLAARIKEEIPGERSAFMVDAIAEKLENVRHGKQAKA